MKDFIDPYVAVLKKYTLFEGRATRGEFWKFVLVSFVIMIVLGIVSDALQALYNLAVLIPSLAVGARRLHDIGKSGWWQLIGIIPVLGWIIIIVLFALEGEQKDNMYGANPRGGSAPAPTATPTPMV
jgi:uncharacterized membrane protein YhaH (DUF805 family)